MRACIRFLLVSLVLSILCSVPALAGAIAGKITNVSGDIITAEFPVPVLSHCMMTIAESECGSVFGLAISQKCGGDGPYSVIGKLSFVTDSSGVAVGSNVYVNAGNVGPGAAKPKTPAVQAAPAHAASGPVDQDLKFYYYAEGQTVGYGALGVGYERTVKISKNLGVELDGGVTGMSSANADNGNSLDTDQLFKNLNGRVKFELTPTVGLYSGYRWSEGYGDGNSWDHVANNLLGKGFVAPSDLDSGTVQQRGTEYGLLLRPLRRLSIAVGYLPDYRADYGSFGIRREPGYTGELRFGGSNRTVRLRGLLSDDYWQADLGITIR